MESFILTQLEYMLRIVLSALCGLVLGVERKNRLKEAGVRTHLIVALGAALMMIVSKYGFYDLAGDGFIKLDPSRIAAQIVSGIGFLGAGMIFMRNQSITGLTTAAGIWATAGIGMTMGAGMYAVALFATGAVLVTQMLLGRWENRSLRFRSQHMITLSLSTTDDISKAVQLLEEMNVKILSLTMLKKKRPSLRLELTLQFPPAVGPAQVVMELDRLIHPTSIHA